MSGDVQTAPPSTADIASSVIDQAEAAESQPLESSPDLGETPPSADTTPSPIAATPEPTPAAALSEEEQLLAEFGFKEAFKPDGREHYIPRSKVLKMIGSGLKRGLEKWTTEKGSLETERDTLKADLEEFARDVRGDTRVMLEKIAQVDPRYRAFLEPAPAPAPQPMDLPAPDADWNGAKTWSMEAFQKSVIPYIVQQAKAEAKAEAEGVLKPLKEREQAEQSSRALQARTRTQIAEAQQWPGFKDHEAAILQALRDDSAAAAREHRRPTLSLDGAYRQVVVPKLAADRNAMREELIKEINGTAAKTPSVRAGHEVPVTPGVISTRDIAARVLSQLERGSS